jgi:multiple sugar transport system permease protein
VLSGFAVLCVIPLLWLAIVPSKTNAEVIKLPPFAFGEFAGYARAWDNLLTFQDGAIVAWLGNSIWYTAAIVAISSVTALMAGYALALGDLPLRKALLMTTLIAMIIPAVALVLPLFIEVVSLGIYNTPWAVILTSSFFPFGTFLAYIYFSTSIPIEIIEAARIDGCGEWKILLLVITPLSRGLLGMLGFFSFTAAWSNYFLPFVMLGSTQNFTLPVGLGILFSSSPALNPSNGANVLSIGRPEIALAGLVVAIPVLIVFLASSRLLARGVFAGSVKS